MNEPIRTHNIGKKKYDVAKQLQKENAVLKTTKACSLELEDDARCDPELPVSNKLPKDTKALPNLPHVYAEEMTMTLADLIIYVCVTHILVSYFIGDAILFVVG